CARLGLIIETAAAMDRFRLSPPRSRHQCCPRQHPPSQGGTMPDTKPIPQAPPLVPPGHHSKREGSATPLDSATSHGPQPIHGKGGSSRQAPTPSLISAIAPPPADAQLTDLLFHDFRRELEREF